MLLFAEQWFNRIRIREDMKPPPHLGEPRPSSGLTPMIKKGKRISFSKYKTG